MSISKKMWFVVIGCIIFMMSTCFAARPKEIPVKDIAIGGITINASEDYVRSVYGEPDEITYQNYRGPEPEHTKTFRYGNSFFITFDADRNTVHTIKTTGNNGLVTPAGFTVGSKISDVKKYYGETSSSDGGKHLVYTYKWVITMSFTADSKGILKEIFITENV